MTTLGDLLERELADAEAKAKRDDELLASAAAGGPFWGVGKPRLAPGEGFGLAEFLPGRQGDRHVLAVDDDDEPAVSPPEPVAPMPPFDAGEPVAVLTQPDVTRVRLLMAARAAAELHRIGYVGDEIVSSQTPFNGRTTNYLITVRGIPAFEIEVRHEVGRFVVTPSVLTWPRPAAERV